MNVFLPHVVLSLITYLKGIQAVIIFRLEVISFSAFLLYFSIMEGNQGLFFCNLKWFTTYVLLTSVLLRLVSVPNRKQKPGTMQKRTDHDNTDTQQANINKSVFFYSHICTFFKSTLKDAYCLLFLWAIQMLNKAKKAVYRQWFW